MSLPPELDIDADEYFTKERLDLAFEYVVAKLRTLESFKPEWETAVNELRQFGLLRLNEALQPVYDRLIAISQIGAVFTAHSTSAVAIGTGEKQFIITGAERASFAAPGYITAFSASSPSLSMGGALLSYDRESGLLKINVDNASGEGAASDWVISAGAAPDATHSGRTDNPHGVSAEQVGAYTKSAVDALIAPLATTGFVNAAISALVDSSPETLDTLKELAAALGDDPNFSTTVLDALAKRVRVDAVQSFTPAEQARARANIGAGDAKSLPSDYVHGLTLDKWSGTTDRANFGVTISPGLCIGNGVAAAKTVTWAKMLNTAWAKGFGAGGLDTGSVQPNATYHAHGIREDSTGDLDFILSASATAPLMPTGWTRVQRIGPVVTDGAGVIRPFVQNGNDYTLLTAIQDRDGFIANNSASTLTLSVPLGIKVKAKLRCSLYDNEVATVLVTSLDETNQAPGLGAQGSITNGVANGRASGHVEVMTNASGQIRVRNSDSGNNGSSDFDVFTYGWIDFSVPRIGG